MMDKPEASATSTSMSAVQIGVVGLWVLALLFTLYFASSILLPFFVALFLAIIVYPVVRWLRLIGVPEGIGAAITLLLVFALIGAGLYGLAEPAADWINRSPQIIEELRAKTWSLRRAVEDAQEAAEDVEEMTDLDGAQPDAVVRREPSLAGQIFALTWSTAGSTIVTLFIMYFLLALGRRTVERMLEALSSKSRQVYARDLCRRLQAQLAAYLQTLTLINVALGTITGIVMAVLGLPNPELWGVLSGLLGYIPYLGPFLMFLIISTVSLLTFDDWARILLPMIAFALIETIEGHFTTPWIIGRRLTLNPIAVFVFILFWGSLWGVMGAILAVPILVSLKIICDGRPGLAPVSALLGTDHG
jgi:predicted PurR-regulated permease PerM